MFRFNHVRALCFALLLSSMVFATSVSRSHFLIRNPTPTQDSTTQSSPDSSAGEGKFYTLRPDLRKCASPLCGGYFIKRVNQSLTPCVNGQNKSECYVASI